LSRVSVIIPVYNRSGVLSRAIDSVLSQDLHDFELVVVDDGSSDGSADVISAYGDPRVRVIQLDEHAGSNAARNAGIRAARSGLLAFLDSDDVFLPHKLSTVVAEFEQRPELDVLVDSFVKHCPGTLRARHNPRVASTEEFRRRLFSRELWKSTSAITVRRDAAFRAGLCRRERHPPSGHGFSHPAERGRELRRDRRDLVDQALV
jgi:glycosyltransferase involved in cell wall biosynthesis